VGLEEVAPDWSTQSSRSGVDGGGGAMPVGPRSCGRRGGGALGEVESAYRPLINFGDSVNHNLGGLTF
jgi:hypothetical protein